MHSAATLIAAVLAAEKSKVPFYIAGGLLAVWALTLSLVIGLRRPAFPGGLPGERIVIAVSVVLVLGALSTAVLTASSPAKSGQTAAAPATPGAPAPGAAQPGGPPSGAPAPTPARASKLSIAANPTGLLAYSAKQLRAPSGRVTIAFTNESVVEHNLTIAEASKVLSATPTFLKSTRSLTLNLKPGTYTFYCSVPGHRQAGMEGTLSVTS